MEYLVFQPLFLTPNYLSMVIVLSVILTSESDPHICKNAYTSDSIWRNRDSFLQGHDEIVQFLTRKWEREHGYRLRKELFAFTDNKVNILLFMDDCPVHA